MKTPKDLVFVSILSNRLEEAKQLAVECNSLIVPSLETSLQLLKDWENKRNISHDDVDYFAGELVHYARQYRQNCTTRRRVQSGL